MKEKANHVTSCINYTHYKQSYFKWLTGLFFLLFLISGCGQKNQDDVTQSVEKEVSSIDITGGNSASVSDDLIKGSASGQGNGSTIHDAIVIEPSAVVAPEPPVAAPMETPVKVEPSVYTPPTKKGNVNSKPIHNKPIGNILYNPPKKMTLHNTERIEVRIGHEKLAATGLVGTGEIVRDELPISEVMSVRLCCGDPAEDHPFDIIALNPDRQIVDKTGYTQWAFNVTPRKSGKQFLDLSVSAHYTYPNGETRTKDSPVKTDQILINVDTKKETQNWFINNWKWLSLLLLVPLLVFYVMRNLKAKKRKVSRSGNEAIFISYRRNDSSGYTLAIYEQLKSTFGDDHVFMDMDDIPHGEDFVEHLEKVLSTANTVLVMIGDNWLNAENANGRRLMILKTLYV